MDISLSMEIVALMCGVVLCIVLLKRKVRFLLSFLSRMCLGVVGILLFNKVLAGLGLAVVVGLNPISLLTSGILGFPGVALLFAIVGTKIL